MRKEREKKRKTGKRLLRTSPKDKKTNKQRGIKTGVAYSSGLHHFLSPWRPGFKPRRRQKLFKTISFFNLISMI